MIGRAIFRPGLVLNIISLICVNGVAACGGQKGEAASGQVVATVNKGEISVHQLNFALRQRSDSAQLDAAAPSKVLDSLIDQEVVVQAALDSKIDRDPAVLLALESGRRELLVRAYLQRATESTSKPTAEEVADYYVQNPALFKERRVYVFQELDVELPAEKFAGLQAQLSALKSAQSVAQAVAASGSRYTTQEATRMPESLPLDLLGRLQNLVDGQTVVVPLARGARVMTLVSSVAAPVSQTQASPLIEQFLLNRERGLVAEAKIKALREKAEIHLSATMPAAHAPATP